MKGILIKTIFLTLTLFIFSLPSSFALKQVQRSTTDLVRSSNDVVVVKCISTETRRDETYNFVFTYITFEIQDNVKDSIGSDELILRMPGGEIDGVLMDVTGVPKFTPDNEYILFLGQKNSHGYHTIQGYTQGVLRISEDESTGSKIVLSNPRDLNIYKKDTSRIISDDKVSVGDFIFSLKQLQ